jgi:cytochrome c peroxidase
MSERVLSPTVGRRSPAQAPRRQIQRLAALVVAAASLAAAAAPAQSEFEPTELRRILQHGPWPPPMSRDPSNRVSGDPRAVRLGRHLFFEPRISTNGAIACATCHVPARAWTDGRPRGLGLATLDRNTPTVLDAARHRWFAWDGRSDSVWSQALKALLDPSEMGASARHVAGVLRADGTLSCLYARAFGPLAREASADERALVDAAKALAAFVETVRSGRTAFDEFRDALARNDAAAAGSYPAAARRGLKTFVGQGSCHVCHFGPHFSNGEFHDVGIPFLVGPGRVDGGRHEGIKRLRADRFNLLGPFNDDATGTAATKTRHVEPQHANFGQFKTPSLRNVALTAPYMHDGRLATLHDVVRHYSRLDLERIHTHGEQLLRPLRLSEPEIDDLVAFLETLTAPDATAMPALPLPAEPCGHR